MGLIINGIAKAYPFKVLALSPTPFSDKVGDKNIFIYFDKENKSAWVASQDGEVIPSVAVYWFAWHAFYPETKIFLPNE